MAIAATLVVGDNSNVRIFDITALDADTTGTFSHNLPFTPDFCLFEPRSPGAIVGDWSRGAISATQFIINKTNAGTSGGAAPGTTVVVSAHVGRWPTIVP